MSMIEEWLAQRGPAVAQALDEQREAICSSVSSQLAIAFPALCYDPARPDAQQFQQRAYRETPRRFHRLMQVALQFHTLDVISREYRWGWPIISRYGVERQPVLMQVRWYFEVARMSARLQPADAAQLSDLGVTIVRMIDGITADTPTLSTSAPTSAPTNGVVRRNGFHR